MARNRILFVGVFCLMQPTSAWASKEAHVPVLTNAEAWKRLPEAEEGGGQDLPVWIRALAGPLPRTAAAMIELDYAQRVENPLPPKLRAQLRWIAADANRCGYAKAQARADYVRAGGKADELDQLPKNLKKLPESNRLALELVRQLTVAAYKVTDDQVAQVIQHHGEKLTVAIVLVAAFANFQDRLLLGLGVGVEENGPLPPVKVKFAKTAAKDRSARRGWNPSNPPPPVPKKLDDPDWTAVSFETLRDKLKGQIERPKARITIPPTSKERKTRIQWSLLNNHYQPRLASAWVGGLRAFREDTDVPVVQLETMFWVVTRSLQCFY